MGKPPLDNHEEYYMKIVINRDEVIEPLQTVAGVVEKKQTVPILSNLLFKSSGDELEIVGTDMEVEIKVRVPAQSDEEGNFTLPAKKFTDICKSLYEGSRITIKLDGDKARITSGRSKFTLSILSANDFPSLETSIPITQFSVEERRLKHMVDKTHFAMAIQDVRYYLNGMLLDIQLDEIATVATDGHRLAYNRLEVENENESQILLPRKAVLEISRLLKDREDLVEVDITGTHLQLRLGKTIFISKLIDGRYPDYNRVIPREIGEVIIADREELRQALIRTSILSNVKFRGINIEISENSFKLLAHNPEQEEAEEEVEVQYQGEPMIVGFNVGYMIEVLSAIEEDKIQLWVADTKSSCLIKGINNETSRYVIMPMRV